MRKWTIAFFSSCRLIAILLVASFFLLPTCVMGFPLTQVVACLNKHLNDQPADSRVVSCAEPISGMEMIPLVYRSRAYRPLWIDERGLSAAAMALIEAIARAGEDGLQPADYHWVAICRVLAEMMNERATANMITPERWADLDLILTDAFLLLGSHLSIGKVNPGTLNADWKIDPGRAPLLPSLIQAATTGDVAGALMAVRPSHDGYVKMCNKLKQLRKIASRGGWGKLPGRSTLRPGDRSDNVAVLWRMMVAVGDLDASAVRDDPCRFDERLIAAVRRFQRRHGLADDGIVGRQTMGMLNMSVGDRIRQVEINLERWRWLPRQLGSRYVWVNTAAFTLDGVEGDQKVLSMRVAVGKPARQSPVFSSKISHLVVNPYWTIPKTIAVKDILPEIQKDMAYLTNRGIFVFANWRADAPAIDPATVNWAAYHEECFPFILRQLPGPRNALGRIKFMLPNSFAVYLHDTPDYTIFKHVKRDLSSGCIRVEAPLALADFVLSGDHRWTSQALMDLIESGDTLTIALGHAVPVHLLYMTAWVDGQGVLQFRDDIYNQDLALHQALNRRRPHQSIVRRY